MNSIYKNMKVWHHSYAFTISIFRMADLHLKEQKEIISQIRRATLSLPLNIAEGSAAESPRVFLNHLIYAYQSCKEVSVLLSICKDMEYVPAQTIEKREEELEMISAMLYKLIETIKSKALKSAKSKYGYDLFWKDSIGHKVAVGEHKEKEETPVGPIND